MDLLVTLDQNYLGPLRVLLGSLFLNDPGEEFHIYMIEEGLTGAQVEELSQLCRAHHSQLHPLEQLWKPFTPNMGRFDSFPPSGVEIPLKSH